MTAYDASWSHRRQWLVSSSRAGRGASSGFDVIVAAIKEEAFPEIEARGAASVHWISLGELSRLIDTFKAAGVTRA